jgi:hypothetical protein
MQTTEAVRTLGIILGEVRSTLPIRWVTTRFIQLPLSQDLARITKHRLNITKGLARRERC